MKLLLIQLIQTHLHSNKVRLKPKRHSELLLLTMDLHSNKVRLKLFPSLSAYAYPPNLHSNKVRLKLMMLSAVLQNSFQFTFQ